LPNLAKDGFRIVKWATSALCKLLVSLHAAQGYGAPASISVKLEPTAQVFRSANEVAVRVTVENTGANCFPVYVDSTFHPVPWSQRPFLLLTFEMRNEHGTVVSTSNMPPSTQRGFRLDDLLLLECGAVYGRYVPLVPPSNWSYELGPGRYTIRARLESPMRTFMRKRTDLLHRLETQSPLSKGVIDETLRDWIATSETTEFEVAGR
jgi:hypothetical protein